MSKLNSIAKIPTSQIPASRSQALPINYDFETRIRFGDDLALVTVTVIFLHWGGGMLEIQAVHLEHKNILAELQIEIIDELNEKANHLFN